MPLTITSVVNILHIRQILRPPQEIMVAGSQLPVERLFFPIAPEQEQRPHAKEQSTGGKHDMSLPLRSDLLLLKLAVFVQQFDLVLLLLEFVI